MYSVVVRMARWVGNLVVGPDRRFIFLLVSLFVICFMSPFLKRDSLGRTLMSLAFSASLLSGIYAVGGRGWFFRVTLAIGVLTTAVMWVDFFPTRDAELRAQVVLLPIFFLFVGIRILIHVAREPRVNTNHISGALCVYLLMGLFWAFVYIFLHEVQADAFKYQGEAFTAPAGSAVTPVYFFRFLYYSFVTISTLGYGDIIPVSPQAQGLSAMEAVVGQLYLAVLIARLVGLQIAQANRTGVRE